MKELLKRYLSKQYNWWDEVHILSFNVDGAVCSVDITHDLEHSNVEHENINIWDMILFLNSEK